MPLYVSYAKEKLNPYSDLVLLWKYISGITLCIRDGRVRFKKFDLRRSSNDGLANHTYVFLRCHRAINPPSASIFQEFVTASKSVSQPSAQDLSVVLVGQGAYATKGPVPVSASSTTTSSTSATPPPVSTTSATQAPASTTSPTQAPASTASSTGTPSAPDPPHTSTTTSQRGLSRRTVGAIAGSVVGGASLLLVLLAFFLCRRHRRRGADEFFKYKGRSLDLGKRKRSLKRRMSFVPSKMIATASAKPPPSTDDWEGRVHPFVKMPSAPTTPGESLWRVSYLNSQSRGTQDPVSIPKGRGVEPGKNTGSAPAEVIQPLRPKRISFHKSAVAGPAPRRLSPRRVPPPKLRLDLAPTADGARQIGSGVTRRATAPAIITKNLPAPLTPWVYTPVTSSFPTPAPPNGGPRPPQSPTRPTSGHTVVGPRPIRPLPRLPPISPPTARVAPRTPGVNLQRTTSTRGLDPIDEKTSVRSTVGRPSTERISDPPPKYHLHGPVDQFVSLGTGER